MQTRNNDSLKNILPLTGMTYPIVKKYDKYETRHLDNNIDT